MRTLWKIILALVLVGIIIGAIIFYKKTGPIVIPPKESVDTETPGEVDPLVAKLSLPEGFSMNIFARNVAGARVMAFDSKGRMLVSQTKEGKITVLEDTNSDGVADTQKTLAEKLNDPHGLAFQCTDNECLLYVAEHNRLGRYVYNQEQATVSDYKKLADLPSSSTDRHTTRTLLFADENTLLISIGSSCNVCEESTNRGKIMAYDSKTGKMSEYATGLRNAVFMTRDYVSGKIFATEMGRDGLGDNIPPDEVNIIEKGKNYGWPICYGKNIHDTDFDKKTYIRNPCMAPFETPSYVDLQAHSAPLGLTFVPEEGWSEDYWYDLLVAYHGSWNRTDPTGYKIVRLKIDSKGVYSGTEDFITGWLTSDGKKIGRPADIYAFPGGTLYITDDMNGLVYRVTGK